MVEAATTSTTAAIVSDIIIHQQIETPFETVDISKTSIENGDTKLWILLNAEPENPQIHLQIGENIIALDNVKSYGKLIILTIPTALKTNEDVEHFKILLRIGSQQIEVPLEPNDAKPDPHIDSLFEFASGGDPFALLKPNLHLINRQNEELCNVLHIAAQNRQNFALKTLITALLDYGDASELEKCMNAVNKRGQTPLHCAVHAGDADCVHYLISAGAKKEIADHNMSTVAHYLGDVYNDDIYKEILETNQKEGLEINGDIDNPLFKKNNDGETPVHIAVRKMKLCLLEALIEAGAPLDVADTNNETPLIIALKMNDTECSNVLIQSKCDVNVTSSSGDTALMLACRAKNLVLIGRLIDAGADVSQSSSDGTKPTDINDEEIIRILNGERICTEEQKTCSTTNLLEPAVGETQEQSTSAYPNHFDNDDVSQLDFLTRLRLSKVLDKEEKWIVLAEHLGCSHMVQFIRVCIDESSSPTMLLLDQYEQIANANLAAVRQALSDMGETTGLHMITMASLDK